MKQRWLTVVTALALLTSCGPTTHRTTGHLANGKAFAVDIGYADKGVGFSVSGHADVADGTPATVDVTGPMHFRCHPTFQPPAAHDGDAIDNLPSFGLAFVPPSGSYAVIVEVPGSGGKLTSHVASINTTGVVPQPQEPGGMIVAAFLWPTPPPSSATMWLVTSANYAAGSRL